MSLIDLASFPNSRIKPRPTTELSVQGQLTIPANTPTLVRPAQSNRTNITIYNQSLTGTLRYKTGASLNIETQGFEIGPNRAVDLDDPQAVYVWCSEEIIINFDDSLG
jgi:hypothetical protein